jgi:Protein of unknown function (DUF3667)
MEAMRDTEAGSTCPNCGARMYGRWCASCGQESIADRGALVRTAQRQWQRIRHTLVALVAHPGQLTVEFRDGLRARSISPWRLTLNVLTVFFLLSFVTDFSVANFPRLDPSGQLEQAVSAAAQRASVDEHAFTERVDRHFNGIFTLSMVLSIAISAVVARLTHFRRRESWSIHFVFALHFTAWVFIVNLVYLLAMRLLGLSLTYGAQRTAMGTALISMILLWEFAYVVVAFHRVYVDGWMSAGAKTIVMLFVSFVSSNLLAVLSFLLAIQVSLGVG